MAELSIDFCRRLAQARRAQGMTQSALAEAVGCKQSAISMLESGQPNKLAVESVRKIAELLGVEFEPEEGTERVVSMALSAPVQLGFCPLAACPTNVPLLVGEVLLFWPRLQSLSGGAHCSACGELLESMCPECGVAISGDGACCSSCGSARVTDTLPPGVVRGVWVEQRLRELATLNTLINQG